MTSRKNQPFLLSKVLPTCSLCSRSRPQKWPFYLSDSFQNFRRLYATMYLCLCQRPKSQLSPETSDLTCKTLYTMTLAHCAGAKKPAEYIAGLTSKFGIIANPTTRACFESCGTFYYDLYCLLFSKWRLFRRPCPIRRSFGKLNCGDLMFRRS